MRLFIKAVCMGIITNLGLLWLAGCSIVLISIPISFYSLDVAYILAAAGVVAGLVSYFKGGRAGKAVTSRAGEPTKMAVR